MRLLRLALALLFLGLAAATPVLAGPREDQLDKMFARLKDTSSETEASALTQAIWILWTTSEDSNVNDMMRRGIRLMNVQNFGEALDIFDRMVKYAPEFAEGWNKRATVLYLLGRDVESLRDCDAVLARNPLHFGALSGMAQIHLRRDDPESALRAYERALAINPHLDGGPEFLRLLEETVRRRGGQRT